MQKEIAIIMGLICIAVTVICINYGMQKNEVVECEQWKQQAYEYPSFYLTDWQKAQCDAAGVEINLTQIHNENELK